jgi:hypothetical protein
MMRRQITGLLFAFLACFATVNGFGEDEYFIPLTWEIVRNERNNLEKAHFYLSKSFSLNINDKNMVKSGFINGVYKVNEEDEFPQIVKFKYGKDKGILDNIFDAPRGCETLDISFPKQDIRLKFARNIYKNRFELISAMYNYKNYALRLPGEPPYLIIKAELNIFSNYEIQGFPFSEGRNPRQDRLVNAPSAGVQYDRINIIGQGSLNKTTIISYIRHRNLNVSRKVIEEIIDTYFWAAEKERINPDIPIVQMCLTTRFLSNENILKTHNYAGFASTREWPIVFNGMRHGITAHIQHLKGYASNARSADLAEPLADPRWNTLDHLRGTVGTLEELSIRWAPDNPLAYENGIKDIIYEMRLFSRQSI